MITSKCTAKSFAKQARSVVIEALKADFDGFSQIRPRWPDRAPDADFGWDFIENPSNSVRKMLNHICFDKKRFEKYFGGRREPVRRRSCPENSKSSHFGDLMLLIKIQGATMSETFVLLLPCRIHVKFISL